MNDILIIGTGWYGLHLAKILKDYNIKFTIFEKNSEIFLESSFKNQNRLHMGYHYPRSFLTRKLCMEGYKKFIDAYSFSVKNLDKNYYLISNDSLLDKDTYKHIYQFEGYDIQEIKNSLFTNVQMVIETNEKVIDHVSVKKYFTNLLNDFIMFNTKITKEGINGMKHKYKYIFDCTNNMLGLVQNHFVYEKTLSLIYKKITNKNVEGITVMDGNFASLYPYDIEKTLYTLTHVCYTPLIKSEIISDVINYKENVTQDLINKFENELIKYYPNFKHDFVYVSYFTSFKTKLKDKSDNRNIVVQKEDNVISFVCGKITGIFMMESYVRKLLGINYVI